MLIVVNLLGLMSTFSRGGFLITAFMAILILFEQRNRFTMRYLGVILAPIAIFLLIGVMFVPEAYLQRQKSITLGREADTSTMRRAAYIDVALKSFQENPVLGTGPFTFKEVWVNSILARKFKIEERPAHNTYLEVLVGSGLVGLIIFLLLLWQALANFSYAKGIFRDMGDTEMASLVGAYRLSFISILIYFFIKSGLDHKFFLLALPLSEIALRMAKDKLNAVKK
jgi:O-antigen ligase